MESVSSKPVSTDVCCSVGFTLHEDTVLSIYARGGKKGNDRQRRHRMSSQAPGLESMRSNTVGVSVVNGLALRLSR